MLCGMALSETLARARAFALQCHGNQRYGDQPYSVHLDAVAAILAPYGEEAQTIGFLHDVLEDTPAAPEALRKEFGDHVLACVLLVTDQPGADRNERKVRTNAKLAAVEGASRVALIAKAADRVANLRESARDPVHGKLEMYRHEHAEFRQAAFRPGLCDPLWAEMDRIFGA